MILKYIYYKDVIDIYNMDKKKGDVRDGYKYKNKKKYKKKK